jgi:dUTP pyrophosphatase
MALANAVIPVGLSSLEEMGMRKFAWLSQFEEQASDLALPVRKTEHSAGYDLSAVERVVVPANQVVLIPTGLKVYMDPAEVLFIIIRSSLAVKQQLILANQVGVIDADYVDNADNEGHILIPLRNLGATPVTIDRGQRVAQGIFVRYHRVDDDQPQERRTGGFGSTSQ